MADAAARPERGAVESADVPFRALVAIGAAAGIDDIGIDLANVLDIELQLLPLRGKIVGEQDVGGFGDLIDELDALGRGNVDTHAALAPVRVLHHRVAHWIES